MQATGRQVTRQRVRCTLSASACPHRPASEGTLICSNCGTEGRAGQKFCLNCGSQLATPCASCGTPLEAGARFCGECGTPVATQSDPRAAPAERPPATAEATAGSSPAAPVAERRLVSILFADLVGFTTLAEGRDAEQVRELLTRYFDTAREIVARYGGTVEKFIGDAVMAVWGAPTAHEDDAERAVRAALDLVEAAASMGGSIAAPDLQLRAGVVTGEAAVTLGAEGQGMVAGDLVNTASRLQSVASPGSVLVGQATRDAASAAISFEEVGEQKLKGKELQVAAWRAVRVVAGLGGARRHAGLEPPFEGRDEDLRLLKELFHATVREKRARLVTIIGQAGTGKSRLIREFEKYTDGLAEDTFWHTGRSPSYGEGITFWALGEMVRKRAGLAERDDDQTTRQRIAATLEDYVPDEGDRRYIEPRLLQLLGVGDARAGEREETFAAWRMFFERVAERGPTVMAFEDLEFADPGMLDFIDYVVEWSRNHPIYILALCRPELLERREGWGAGHRNYTAIGLEPLSDQAMRQALAGLVPGLPATAVKQILMRAEGVPLYAVETVRMLLNDGRLAEHDGIYEPVGDLTELEVPNTLHALIAARLDALDPADRSVLQDAAVLGQTFSVAALVGIGGQPGDEVEPRLRSLVRREVLELNVDPLSPERGQYGFVQGLVREVAYSTLSKRDRRTRHLAAARYFEVLGDEELAGALAIHYLDAWKAAPEGPEGDAVAAQARVALRAAAERAAALHSPAQALSYLEHLLSVTTDPAERAAVLERAGDAAEATARFDLAEKYAEEAMDISRSLGDRSALARAAEVMSRALLGTASLDRGIKIVQQTLDELVGLEEDPATVHLLAALARLKALSNDNEEAIELAERALVAAERLDLVEVIAGAVMTKGVALAYLNRNREAMLLLPGVLLLAETHGMVVIEMRARLNISQFQIVDEPVTAGSMARIGMEKAQKLGLRYWETLLAGNAVMAALRTGDWDWALKAGADVLRDDPVTTSNSEVDAYPAIITALRGDGGARLSVNVEVIAPLSSSTADPQYPALVSMLRTWQQLTSGDVVAASNGVPMEIEEPTYASAAYSLAGHAALWLRERDRAVHILDALNKLTVRGQWVSASRRSLAAGIAALAGQTADAVAGFAEATRILRDHGMPLDTALCLMDEVATIGTDEPAGRAAADEAREILQGLGATVLLDQLDRLAAPSGPYPAEQAAEPVGATGSDR
jgi:class 3 adenylate cyclase/tetratricopeptide (TPR) repeat protein